MTNTDTTGEGLDPRIAEIMEARQKRAEAVHERVIEAREKIRTHLHPESPSWQREAFDLLHAAHHILGGDPFDMHMRAALAEQGEAPQPATDGWVPVPAKMYLSSTAISNLVFQCGYEEDGKQEFFDSVAWVGEIEVDSDDPPVHGLHIYSTEYPEDGSVTLAEFPARPKAGSGQ